MPEDVLTPFQTFLSKVEVNEHGLPAVKLANYDGVKPVVLDKAGQHLGFGHIEHESPADILAVAKLAALRPTSNECETFGIVRGLSHVFSDRMGEVRSERAPGFAKEALELVNRLITRDAAHALMNSGHEPMPPAVTEKILGIIEKGLTFTDSQDVKLRLDMGIQAMAVAQHAENGVTGELTHRAETIFARQARHCHLESVAETHQLLSERSHDHAGCSAEIRRAIKAELLLIEGGHPSLSMVEKMHVAFGGPNVTASMIEADGKAVARKPAAATGPVNHPSSPASAHF